MRILLTNDDGIHAPGILHLHDAIATLGEVFISAPLTVQSATGHGITFRQPLIIKELEAKPGLRGIAIDGRPADCVKLAVADLWPSRFGPRSRPDLVVSGMNMGANVGINVLYSGTIAAALEAAFLGLPAIAVSLHHGKSTPRYDIAARHARAVIDRILAAGGVQPGHCLSINIPVTEREGPTPPVVVCPMNTHGLVDAYQRNRNPLGETYFWSAGTPMEFHATEAGSDVQSLQEGRITVTPLKFDLTAHEQIARWHGRL